MDVHPTKNGINRYWSIAIWEQDLVRSELHGPENWSPNPSKSHDVSPRCAAEVAPWPDLWVMSSQVWSMRLQVWIPSYKNLENVEIPKDSYSFLFNPIHQWQDPWPPLRSLALQTSESGLCGMVLIGDLDSMIPGPKPKPRADSYWKKTFIVDLYTH